MDAWDTTIQRGLFHFQVLEPTLSDPEHHLCQGRHQCVQDRRGATAGLGCEHLPLENRAQKPNPCPKPNWLGAAWTAGGQPGGGTGSESLKMWLLEHCPHLRKQNRPGRAPPAPRCRRRARSLSTPRSSRSLSAGSYLPAEAEIKSDYKSSP